MLARLLGLRFVGAAALVVVDCPQCQKLPLDSSNHGVPLTFVSALAVAGKDVLLPDSGLIGVAGAFEGAGEPADDGGFEEVVPAS